MTPRPSTTKVSGTPDDPSAIRAWLVQRYGTWISYKPTPEPAAWPLWLAPLALLVIGGWLIGRRIRLKVR
jgi:cytochrome c-type biogenesis protein CcmH